MRSIICFLKAEIVQLREIHRSVIKVYGTRTTTKSSVRFSVQNFQEGRTEVHDEERSSDIFIITKYLQKCVDDFITADPHVKPLEMSKKFHKISQ